MNNKITDLNTHLFAQLKRLGNIKLNEDELKKESQRASAIVSVSEQLIESAKLSLDSAKLIASHGVGRWELMLPHCVKEDNAPVADKNVLDYSHGEVKGK